MSMHQLIGKKSASDKLELLIKSYVYSWSPDATTTPDGGGTTQNWGGSRASSQAQGPW